MVSSLATVFGKLTENATLAGIISLIAAAVGTLLWNHYSLRFWAWWRWHLTREQYFLRRAFKRNVPFVVCLDEYVYILEKLRNSIAKKCAHVPAQDGKLPEILINVYTKQLPSDWPLWGASIDPNENPQTSLERYVRDFQRFLNQGSDCIYSVKVRRIIVIDNGLTDIAKNKCKRIYADTHDNTFQDHWNTYLRYLHNNDSSGAKVYWTERPWPGWISDAVFYGIREPNKALRWLWGVTTSYQAGEDLILLRLHHKLNRKLDGRWWSGGLTLPTGVITLKQLAERADNYPNAVTLPMPIPWEPWKDMS